MDPPHFYKWLAMTFEGRERCMYLMDSYLMLGATDEEFNEGIQDLISCTSPAAKAGQKLNARMSELAKKLFRAYDTDASGVVLSKLLVWMLQCYRFLGF